MDGGGTSGLPLFIPEVWFLSAHTKERILTIGYLIGWIVLGLVAGGLARLRHRGQDAMGLAATIIGGVPAARLVVGSPAPTTAGNSYTLRVDFRFSKEKSALRRGARSRSWAVCSRSKTAGLLRSPRCFDSCSG
jgi:hypothetical protein